MIRQFRPEDASSCCQVIHACLGADASLTLGLRRKIRASETARSILQHAGLCYVAVYESEERILGLIGLDLNEIRLLCVSPACQRQGIGRLLFEHIKAMVPAALFQEIFVYASVDAVGFYKACGFVDRGPCILKLSDALLETTFMAFPLSQAPEV